MDTFESYFSFENILRQLCKYRIQAARKRHKLHLIRDVSLSNRSLQDFINLHPIDDILKQILPPRRQWISIKKEHRTIYKSSIKRNRLILYRTVIKTHISSDCNPKPEWYINLIRFIETVRECVGNNSNYIISKPSIRPEIKKKLANYTECRPLAEYTYFDRIIISLTAKYLTDLFDSYLVNDSSYAFRSSKSKPVKNHHECITEIRNYIIDNSKREIWVSECDIKKFFDCVDHTLAVKSLQYFVEKAQINGVCCHQSAIRIFNSYLNSYNYLEDVYKKDDAYFKNFRIKNGCFPLPLGDLKNKFYCHDHEIKIGVPQGGAISCLIANLLLHFADEEVLKVNDEGLRYLRFCDDMVILAESKESCVKALERYLAITNDLKLLTHPPIECNQYSSQFWNAKSKFPYKLSKSSIPWVSFVGYQIRYDGIVRIRKTSIRKEIDKQRKEANKVLAAIDADIPSLVNKSSRKSKKQQVAALESRLISMSVGRVSLHNWKVYTPEYCWAIGFKKLNFNHAVSGQLKNLDRERNKQLHRFKRKLADLTKEIDNPDRVHVKTYKGSPFSYHFRAKTDSTRK